MNKSTTKRMFEAIQAGDAQSLYQILDAETEALETVGEHNRNVRDKTPLMFAMQCRNLRLAHALLDRGANAAAEMPGGPGDSVLSNMRIATPLATMSGYASRHDSWITERIPIPGFGRRCMALGGSLCART